MFRLQYALLSLLIAVQIEPISTRFENYHYDYAYDYGVQDKLPDVRERQCRSPPIASVGIPPYPVGTMMQISCPSGYELVGERRSACDSHGSWTAKSIGYCVEIAKSKVSCIRPSTHANVYIVQQSDPYMQELEYHYKPGNFIRFACIFGYRLVESMTEKEIIYCMSNGEWSAEPVICSNL